MYLDASVEQGRARRIKTESALEGEANATDTVAAHLPLLLLATASTETGCDRFTASVWMDFLRSLLFQQMVITS